MKAGFEHVADFVMSGDVSGAGKLHHLLIKKFAPNKDKVHPLKDDGRNYNPNVNYFENLPLKIKPILYLLCRAARFYITHGYNHHKLMKHFMIIFVVRSSLQKNAT